MDTNLDKCIFQNRFSLISVTYVVGTYWNCLIETISIYTYNICQFNKSVLAIHCFHKLLNYFVL